MSDEVDYLLSILGKEGYAALHCWMPTDSTDKYDVGKFLNYLESTWMIRSLPVLQSMNWKMSRRGQMRQLMHSLIVYSNLLTVY